MPDPAIRITESDSFASLPQEALALFGGDNPFATPAWYRATIEHALPPGAKPVFLLARQSDACIGVIPMLRGPGKRFSSLTTPYTCLWQPLLAEAVRSDPARLSALGRCLGDICAAAPATRLDALDPDDPSLAALRRGIRASGLGTFSFDHFANWHLRIAPGTDWAGYLGSRPAALRETIRRRTRRLVDGLGAAFSVIDSPRALEPAIADYETIYAASWKRPEPFPRFNAALMRAAAGAGMLRLGLLHLQDMPVAAQIWIVHAGCATVLKLAHAESHRALSPGTVLTALMIQRLLETEAITALDFGRGDDPYKELWTGSRRMRIGLLLANPRTPQGAALFARQACSFLKKRTKRLLLLRRSPLGQPWPVSMRGHQT